MAQSNTRELLAFTGRDIEKDALVKHRTVALGLIIGFDMKIKQNTFTKEWLEDTSKPIQPTAPPSPFGRTFVQNMSVFFINFLKGGIGRRQVRSGQTRIRLTLQ